MSVNRSSVDEKKIETKKSDIFFRLLKYTASYKKEVIAVIAMMMVASIILVALPLLTENAVDVQIKNGNLKGLLVVTAIFIGLVFVWWLIYVIRVRIMARVANNIVLTIRDEVFAHLLSLGLYYFDSRPTGKILSRLIGDITSMKDMLKQVVTTIVPNIFFVICILIAMFALNPILSCAVILALPLLCVGSFLLMKKNYPIWYDYRQKQRNITGFVHESFSGSKVIQSFLAEGEVNKEFERENDDIRSHWTRAVAMGDTMGIIIDASQGIGYFFLFFFAIFVLKMDGSSVGQLIAFSTYIGLFWQPIRALANMYNQLSNNLAGAGRVFEILDEKSTLKEIEAPLTLTSVKGNVRFENVSFAYPDEKDKLILKDVSFTVKEGEKIALVGPTGAGKTTIVNLLCRFYDASSGKIFIDNNDICKLLLSSLKANVAVMTQECYLFSGSIYENIKYGNDGATNEDVIASCRLVGADEFIKSFKEGYEADVSQIGLSQGQKQLLALARTLLTNPKILILDEATSNIDTHTELLVQKGIETLMKGRTCFVVAHRLSTIRNANRIFVVNNQGIIEDGTHEELMALNQAYATLYKAQFKD